jgi:hypothetical protein
MTKMPEPIDLSDPNDEESIYGYTADQLKQAIRDALEEAAQLMECQDTQDPKYNAKAIRAMKENI